MPYNFPVIAKVALKLTKSNLDNVVDRAHYFFTFALVLLFCLINAGELLFGSPIQCMAPAEYGTGWGAFVNEYCFINGTYVEGKGPDSSFKIDVTYYQWFAYVLLIQCLMFYAPHFIWSSLQNMADVDVQGVVDRCVSVRTEMDPKKKNDVIDDNVKYLKKVMEKRRGGFHMFGGGLGDLATLYYIGSKCFNLLNVLLQFYMISRYVGHGGLDWGFKVLRDAASGKFWDQTGFFPRLSICEFKRNDLASETVKESYCVLMLNMVNEKIFAILYFWFIALSVVTLADLVHTLAIYLCSSIRLHKGKSYLKNVQQLAPDALVTGERKNYFVTEVLGRDGLLLLRFIESHAGVMIASQVACRLFEKVNGSPRNGIPVGAVEMTAHSEKPDELVQDEMV